MIKIFLRGLPLHNLPLFAWIKGFDPHVPHPSSLELVAAWIPFLLLLGGFLWLARYLRQNK